MESEQKQDAEQRIPLVHHPFFECALWILVPTTRETGEFNVRVGFHKEDGILEPGFGYDVGVSSLRKLKRAEASYNYNLQCNVNVFHTLLISKQADISKFKLEMSDRDWKDINIPSIINLMPEEHVDAFWNQEKTANFLIVRWGVVHFRGKCDLSNYPEYSVTWDLIEADEKYVSRLSKTRGIRLYTEEDEVLKKKELMETVGSQSYKVPRTSAEFDILLIVKIKQEGNRVVNRLREWCDCDDIHLVCSYWLHSKDGVNVSTFKDCVCEQPPIDSIHTSKITTIFGRFHKTPIAPYFRYDSYYRMSSDEFANALGDLREVFVKSVHSKHGDILHTPQEQEHEFDRNFLHLSNGRHKDNTCFIVYDDRRRDLHLVDFKSHINHFAGWNSSGFCKYPKYPGNYCKSQKEDFQLIVRRNWIKYQCLYGQDDEFNIFRSLCFAPPSSVVERYQMGFVALTLQILLSIGIAVDSLQMWSNKYSSFEDFAQAMKSFEYQFEDIMIVTISMFTLAFILQRLRKTIEAFKQFYSNIKEVCIIPTVIIASDFTSNIIVGTLMAIVTPFFLLQSEDIQTVVLNSFALTYFIELDDLANIYESDEPILLQEDKNGWQRDWENYHGGKPGVFKRKIEGLGSTYKSLKMTAAFVFSPLYETFKIIATLLGMCCSKKKQQVMQNWTDSDLDQLTQYDSWESYDQAKKQGLISKAHYDDLPTP